MSKNKERIEELERFLESVKKPTDIRSPQFTQKENIRIADYQKLAPHLFKDLKKDGYMRFENYYDVNAKKTLEELDRQSLWFARFVKIASNVSNKLGGFSGEEQFFILGSIYVFWCEQIKKLFIDFIRPMNYNLPRRKREQFGYPTLTPVIRVLSKYRNGKYNDLFSDVDCDLRNAFAHFNLDFDDKKNEIVYGGRRITSIDFLSLTRKMAGLLSILYAEQLKVFAPEFEKHAQKAIERVRSQK